MKRDEGIPPQLVDEDLRKIVAVTLDLAYYRRQEDDGGLGEAAFIELLHHVAHLPEGSEESMRERAEIRLLERLNEGTGFKLPSFLRRSR